MNKFKNIILSMFVLFTIGATTICDSYAYTEITNTIPVFKVDKKNGHVTNSLNNKDKKDKILDTILREYRGIVVFVLALSMLLMITFFIINFIALGNTRGNPQARQKAINGLIMSGIGTAGIGSVILITTLFYNMIN